MRSFLSFLCLSVLSLAGCGVNPNELGVDAAPMTVTQLQTGTVTTSGTETVTRSDGTTATRTSTSVASFTDTVTVTVTQTDTVTVSVTVTATATDTATGTATSTGTSTATTTVTGTGTAISCSMSDPLLVVLAAKCPGEILRCNGGKWEAADPSRCQDAKPDAGQPDAVSSPDAPTGCVSGAVQTLEAKAGEQFCTLVLTCVSGAWTNPQVTCRLPDGGPPDASPDMKPDAAGDAMPDVLTSDAKDAIPECSGNDPKVCSLTINGVAVFVVVTCQDGKWTCPASIGTDGGTDALPDALDARDGSSDGPASCVNNELSMVPNGEAISCSANGLEGAAVCVNGTMTQCVATSAQTSGLRAVLDCQLTASYTASIVLSGNVTGNIVLESTNPADTGNLVQVCMLGDGAIGGMDPSNRLWCKAYNPDSNFRYVFNNVPLQNTANRITRITFIGVTAQGTVRWSNNMLVKYASVPGNLCSNSEVIVGGTTAKMSVILPPS